MFENFDVLNNQKPDDDEDSETLSYSYPSYSRFTYTGKTKSRLGRSRFMRQSETKEETKQSEGNRCGTSELKTSAHFVPSNSQAPKTPSVRWLQRNSSLSANPFTPVDNSKNVHGSCSELNNFPTQSNFLFNLQNDSVQNSTCKQNLPFSTTPFKVKENQSNALRDIQCNALWELNQLLKPENPFSKLDFSKRSKEEKENTGRTKTENGKPCDFDPSWGQLKNICDAATSYPTSKAKPHEINVTVSKSDQSDFRRKKESLKTSLFTPFNAFDRRDEKKKDDDSSNIPLDLSSAENLTSKSLFSKSLNSESDQLDGDTSGSLNHQFKDAKPEPIEKADDSTNQKSNADALSGFLPKFLVPKNRSSVTESPDDDISVVENMIDHQPKHQMSLQAPMKTKLISGVNCGVATTGNDMNSSTQCKSVFLNDMKTTTLPSLSTSSACKQPSSFSSSQTNNEVQTLSQIQIHQSIDKKSTPDIIRGIIPLEHPGLSPTSAHSLPQLKNVVNGHPIKKQDRVHQSNLHSIKNYDTINLLAQNVDVKLSVVSNSSANERTILIETVDQHQRNTNESSPTDQTEIEVKSADNLITSSSSTQEKLYPVNQTHRSEPSGSEYQTGMKNDARPPESVERNDIPIQPKPAVGHSVDPRPPENIQSSQLSQKTYLAPQQVNYLDGNNVSDFPYVKPEIPQLLASKSNFPAGKKLTQFKMSAPRGMPCRTDTELSVNGKSYAILSMLGKGGSSEVYQVLDPRSSKLLAVKCVDLSMVDKTIADGYLNEIDLLSKLQGCASVIRMFDYEYSQECKLLYVVMEKGDTDLSHLIRDISKTKKISMSMIIYYWTEMLQAVKDIHDRGIIHSDLKPANFLLVSGRLKLIDFGIASSQGDMTSVVKEVTTGTWNYMSPEAIKNTSASGKGFKITYKSDVWSLGCILYNLVYGKTPFSHITNTWGKLTAIADPNHCIEFPDVGAPAVLVKALRSCFHREPKLRPTVAELLSLPYHSTGDSGDLGSVGRQVQALLPAQWWHKVAHLFPGVKPIQEGKSADNADLNQSKIT